MRRLALLLAVGLPLSACRPAALPGDPQLMIPRGDGTEEAFVPVLVEPAHTTYVPVPGSPTGNRTLRPTTVFIPADNPRPHRMKTLTATRE